MFWKQKKKTPSKYRIVPKGTELWAIQRWDDWREIYRNTFCFIYADGSQGMYHYDNYSYTTAKVFVSGTMEECKRHIDIEVAKDNKFAAIEAREKDTSLYLDYP